MNWYKTEDGTLINLDLVRYITHRIWAGDGYEVVFDEFVNSDAENIESIFVHVSENDYKNIKNIVLNK